MAVIVPSGDAAAAFCRDLCFFLPEAAGLLTFPAYNLLPFKRLAYHGETAARRIRTLYRLTASDVPPLVVVAIDALVQKIIPKQALIDYVDLVLPGEPLDSERLVARLVAGGYTRSVITEEPGDFSVRGGIVDVFSPLYDEPLRIERFGDVVDELRFFSAETSARPRPATRRSSCRPARRSSTTGAGRGRSPVCAPGPPPWGWLPARCAT